MDAVTRRADAGAMRTFHSLIVAAAILAVAAPSAALAADGAGSSNGNNGTLARGPGQRPTTDQQQNQGQGQSGQDQSGHDQGGQGQSGRRNPALPLAALLCRQEAEALGRDSFLAKYGSEAPRRACVETALPTVKAALTACRTSADGKGGARACVAAKLGLQAPAGEGRGGPDQGQGAPGRSHDQSPPGQNGPASGGQGQGGGTAPGRSLLTPRGRGQDAGHAGPPVRGVN